MKYEIVFAPEAVQDFKCLSARERATVRDAIERRLRDSPEKPSKSEVKRLRSIRQPRYRLRVSDIRVYYDVEGETVETLAIVPKSRAAVWLEEFSHLPENLA
jgi:mRNA-degrading endonuclease RelE of RelBE toxin-antitoxin system